MQYIRMSFSIRATLAVLLLFTLAACFSQSAIYVFDIAAFKAADKANPPPENAVLFVGSSSIRLWDTLAEDMAPMLTINRGFGGSTLQDVLYYTDHIVTPYKPKIIVIYVGDNDVSAGVSVEEFTQTYQTFVAKVRESLPSVPIYYISIKPSIARESLWQTMEQVNHSIETLSAQDPTLFYIDIASDMFDSNGEPRAELFRDDGLHMTDAGYQLWTSIINPILMAQYYQ